MTKKQTQDISSGTPKLQTPTPTPSSLALYGSQKKSYSAFELTRTGAGKFLMLAEDAVLLHCSVRRRHHRQPIIVRGLPPSLPPRKRMGEK